MSNKGTFRSRQRRTAIASSRRRSTGARGGWSDELRIPNVGIKSSGIPVVFTNASYDNPVVDMQTGLRDEKVPFFVYKQGKVAKDGGKQIRTDCIPQYWPIPEDADDYPMDDPRIYVDRDSRKDNIFVYLRSAGDNRATLHTRNCFNLVDLRIHHVIEKRDRDGKVITYSRGDKAGQPIMERVPCEGKGCEHCDNKVDIVLGRQVYVDVGPRHKDNIFDLEVEVSEHCRSCQEGQIERASFICPECGEVMLELADENGERTFSIEEEDDLYEKGMKCPECNTPGVLPMEELACTVCEDASRATLADVVIFIRKTGENTDTKISAKLRGEDKPWVWLKDFDITGDEDYVIEDYDVKVDDDGDVVMDYTWHDDIKPLTTQFNFGQMRGVGIPFKGAKQVCDFLGVSIPEPFEGEDDGNQQASGSSRRGSGRKSGRGGRRGGTDSRRRSY